MSNKQSHDTEISEEMVDKVLTDPDYAISILQSLKEERHKRLLAEQKIKEDTPKVLFADAVAASHDSCTISELAKILKQNGLSLGQNRLFEWMRENGYLCERGDAHNRPTQKAMDLQLLELKQTIVNSPNGTIIVSTTTKVTGKGQIYFVNKMLGTHPKK